ncbi:sialidase family protein [Aerolutibacter daejeonensis]|uniref:sialidase family protein n=1 Tax=Aerolutibacter daejeonensis TaxID=346181 RepID=UPI00068EA205|nr:sialidase family protein [Lysobacter daejeonensis]
MRPILAPLALATSLTLAVSACQPADDRAATPSAADAADAAIATAQPDPAPLVQSDWPLPATGRAAQPDLIVAPDGTLVLSWIESAGKTHTLRLATRAPGAQEWGTPVTVDRGDDWFVNWADTPHVAMTADGALWTHWLQKSAAATYAYDVALVRSADGGRTWSKPVLVNTDGTPTEHGFVSLWAAGPDRVGVAWLDGRHTAKEADAAKGAAGAHAGHGGHDDGAGMAAGTGGASATTADTRGAANESASQGLVLPAPATPMMTLRTAHFDAALQRHDEQPLDLSTCDCCQTDATVTDGRTLLAYRDRTESEIRDIYVARHDGQRWLAPVRAHADDWRMPACPVNGPALAAHGRDVLVGWYTAAGDVPALKLARSTNAADAFAAPVVVDRGEAVQGRVDVALADDAAWVLWVRETPQGQSLHLARYTPDLSRELQRVDVAQLQGRGRATGFPQLVLADGGAYVVWTDVVEGRPLLKGARFAERG